MLTNKRNNEDNRFFTANVNYASSKSIKPVINIEQFEMILLERQLKEVSEQRNLDTKKPLDTLNSYDDFKMTKNDREFLHKIKKFQRKEEIIKTKLNILEQRAKQGFSSKEKGESIDDEARGLVL